MKFEHREVYFCPFTSKKILTKYIGQLKEKMYLNALVYFNGFKMWGGAKLSTEIECKQFSPSINNDVYLRCDCFA